MYKLYYWFSRGRAEQIRLLLSELDQDWDEIDTDWGSAAWEGLRFHTLWFGQQPALADNEFTLVQGPVICGYLARKHGLALSELRAGAVADALALGADDLRNSAARASSGDDRDRKQAAWLQKEWLGRWVPALDYRLEKNGDSGFFVGPSITHADTCLWDALDQVMAEVPGAKLPSGRVQQFYDAIRERPRIRGYLRSPRRPGE